MSPSWIDDYVGLPFQEHGRDRSGLDCWGLVRLVLAERFAVQVPSFGEVYERVSDRETIAKLVQAERLAWTAIVLGRERSGDVALLRLRGAPMHVGLVVAPPLMLHVERGIGSALASYRGLRWRSRLLGFYRHPALCVKAA
ncbi:MAG: NlpC/P60 family protein [Kiloniellaceae bacterium]